MDRKSKLCLIFLKTNKKNAYKKFKEINSEVSNNFYAIGLNVNITTLTTKNKNKTIFLKTTKITVVFKTENITKL